MAQRYRLLVIDDEQPILDEIKSYFEKRDFKVETALSGEEGLQKLRTQEFDVALIDLCMPNSSKNGLDIIEAIEDEYIPVRTAIITGHGEKEDAVAALNLGTQAWFEKSSLDLEKVYKSIKNMAQIIPEEKFEEFMAVLNEKR